MAERMTRKHVAVTAIVHDEMPVREPTTVDRTFEIPAGIYMTMVGLFLAFLALLAVGFSTPQMILPMALFAFVIIAGFAIPTIWSTMAPATASKAKSWNRFKQDGIQTAYGRTTARDATIQVLILPVLIFLWGIAVVTVAAIVR